MYLTAQRRPESGSGDNPPHLGNTGGPRQMRSTKAGVWLRRQRRCAPHRRPPLSTLNEGRSLAPATTRSTVPRARRLASAQRRPESGSGDNVAVGLQLAVVGVRSTKAGVWLRRQRIALLMPVTRHRLRSTKAGVWLRRQLERLAARGGLLFRSTKAGVWLRRQLALCRAYPSCSKPLNEGRSLAPATTGFNRHSA